MISPQQLQQCLSQIACPFPSNINSVDNNNTDLNALLSKNTRILTEFLKHQQCVEAFLNQILNSQQDEVRQIACILLRSKVKPHQRNLNSNLKSNMASSLLQKIFTEQNRAVRTQMIELVDIVLVKRFSECFYNESILDFDENQHVLNKSELVKDREKIVKEYEQLIQNLIKYASDSNSVHRESALKLMHLLIDSDVIPVSIFEPYFDSFLNAIRVNLYPNNNPNQATNDQILLETLQNCQLLFLLAKEPNHVQRTSEMFPRLMEIITHSIEHNNTELAAAGFETLEDFTQSQISIVETYFQAIVDFMFRVLYHENVDYDIRSCAIMFIEWLCEFHPKKILKSPDCLKKIIDCSVAFMVGSFPQMIKQEQERNEENDEDDDEIESVESQGSALARGICTHFDTSLGYQSLFKVANQLINSQNERERKGAYVILASLPESHSDHLKKEDTLDNLVKFIVKGMSDHSSMVRRYATDALIEFAMFLEPEINQKHELIIPALLSVLDTQPSQNQSIYRITFTALEIFVKSMNGEQIRPYLERIAHKLFLVLGDNAFLAGLSPKRCNRMRSDALSALASLASAAQQDFVPYFSQIAGYLRQQMMFDIETCKQNLSSDDQNMKIEMRGECIDCVGSLAKAVGRTVFDPYFNEFMRLAFQGLQIKDSDVWDQTFSFFESIVEVYESGFTEKFSQLNISNQSSKQSQSNDSYPALDPLYNQITESILSVKRDTSQNALNQSVKNLNSGKTTGNQFLDGILAANSQQNEEENSKQEFSECDEDSDDDAEDIFNLSSSQISEIESALSLLGTLFKYSGPKFIDTYFDAIKNLLEYCDVFNYSRIATTVSRVYFELISSLHENLQKHRSEMKILPQEADSLLKHVVEYYLEKLLEEYSKDIVSDCIYHLKELILLFGIEAIESKQKRFSKAVIMLLNQKAVCQQGHSDFDTLQEQLQQFDSSDDENSNENISKPEPSSLSVYQTEADSDIDAGITSTLYDTLLDLLIAFTKKGGQACEPRFRQFLPPLVQYFNSSKSPLLRSTVIGALAEIASNLGNSMQSYAKSLVDMVFEALQSVATQIDKSNSNDIDTFLFQCAFALGSFYYNFDSSLMDLYFERTLQVMQPWLQIEEKSSKDRLLIRDNSCSCLAKMLLKSQRAKAHLNEIVPVFLRCLPIQYDIEEQETAYNCFFGLQRDKTELMLNHIDRILIIVASCLARERPEEFVNVQKPKFLEFARHLLSPQVPYADRIHKAFQTLPNDMKQILSMVAIQQSNSSQFFNI